jgi:hypothetical protein
MSACSRTGSRSNAGAIPGWWCPSKPRIDQPHITDTNKMQQVLFGMQSRTFDPYFAALNRTWRDQHRALTSSTSTESFWNRRHGSAQNRCHEVMALRAGPGGSYTISPDGKVASAEDSGLAPFPFSSGGTCCAKELLETFMAWRG